MKAAIVRLDFFSLQIDCLHDSAFLAQLGEISTFLNLHI